MKIQLHFPRWSSSRESDRKFFKKDQKKVKLKTSNQPKRTNNIKTRKKGEKKGGKHTLLKLGARKLVLEARDLGPGLLGEVAGRLNTLEERLVAVLAVGLAVGFGLAVCCRWHGWLFLSLFYRFDSMSRLESNWRPFPEGRREESRWIRWKEKDEEKGPRREETKPFICIRSSMDGWSKLFFFFFPAATEIFFSSPLSRRLSLPLSAYRFGGRFPVFVSLSLIDYWVTRRDELVPKPTRPDQTRGKAGGCLGERRPVWSTSFFR